MNGGPIGPSSDPPMAIGGLESTPRQQTLAAVRSGSIVRVSCKRRAALRLVATRELSLRATVCSDLATRWAVRDQYNAPLRGSGGRARAFATCSPLSSEIQHQSLGAPCDAVVSRRRPSYVTGRRRARAESPLSAIWRLLSPPRHRSASQTSHAPHSKPKQSHQSHHQLEDRSPPHILAFLSSEKFRRGGSE